MSEDLDKREQFIDRVLSILELPYINSLNSMGIDDIDTQKLILSKLFNDNVTIEYYDYDVHVYHSNGDKVYYEDSNGEWYKREYDLNGNQIYYEDSDGYWYKIEYDTNGKEIYYEDSDGEWYKREYDSNGNEIYFENSDGDIIDNRNTINESEDKKDMFVNRVLSILELPYIKYLNNIGIDDENTQKVILSRLFNDDITIEYVDDYVYISNSLGNQIYYENSSGYWFKKEYDSNGKRIYYEDSDGEWYKREYDSNGNRIYYEDSDGYIVDKRNNINESEDKKEQFINRVLSILELPYINSLDNMGIDDENIQKLILSKLFNDDITIEYYGDDYVDIYNSNGNKVYYEHPSGYWYKWEYDPNGNGIYYENSTGFWSKWEYDSNGNDIYFENSDGDIIDNRNTINESEDKKEQLINKVLSILDTPYINSLNSIGIDDENTQKLILSRLFNDDITIEYYGHDVRILNSSKNEIYYEYSSGYWFKKEYDSNGNKIYYEDSDGDWVKYEYDSNGNEIYLENSDGYWTKNEYDPNGYQIYHESSSGYWFKNEFDSNGSRIYYEDSNGKIIDKRNSINESEDKRDMFVNRVLSILELPYFKSLNNMGIDDKDTQKLILSRLFNDDVTIKYGNDYVDIYNSNGNEIYYEYSSGFWCKIEYDSNGNKIYYEDSDGYWYKIEYDYNEKEIYYEDSDGQWYKREYDSNGNLIYSENNTGYIIDRRNNINESEDKKDMFVNRVLSILELPYFKSLNTMGIDDKDTQKLILSKLYNDDVIIHYGDEINIYKSNRRVYNENSRGGWYKYEYDSNGNEIYFENSDGYWVKREYDSKRKVIYREDSNGYIIDRRNNINESEDKKEHFINKVLSILDKPYIKSLNSIGIDDRDTQKLILSRLFNDDIVIYYDDTINIYNSKGNEIYSEDSDGYWVNYEYDSNGRVLYFESSDGYWYKNEYDSNGNKIYFENSNGYWIKREYDPNGNDIYYENSNGVIIDKRNNPEI